MLQETELKIKTGITAPKGFKAAGIHCGIKKAKKDLALIYTESPAVAAAVFTLNKVQAAPVLLCKKHLKENNKFHAIIVNSGNANACTGDRGFKDAVETAELTADVLNITPQEVFVSSTGVIGENMPMEKLKNGIKNIIEHLTDEDDLSAAQAIMTTDTFPKSASVSFDINGKTVSIGGISKGSGMIHPNMATMLAFITTDASIDKNIFQSLLKEISEKTFNRIIVDGDTSTNDMVVALANRQSGIEQLLPGTTEYELFSQNLYSILKKLSIDIVRDGEGATKMVEIKVEGAQNDKDALIAAKSVALSPLVKTAIHGEDANWGRIIAAVGYSGIEFNPDDFEIFINGIQILKKNYNVIMPASEANKLLKPTDINLVVKLNKGNGTSTCWTCDFSEDYVKINGSYRS